MARRRVRRTQATVTLFPFLSILACVIGTLTLVIAALALRQVASDLGDGPQGDASIALAALSDESRSVDQRLAASRQAERRIRALEEWLRGRGIDPDSDPEAIARVLAERREARALGVRLPALREELAAIEALIARGNARIESLAGATSAAAKITLQPYGSGSALVPYFVECRRDAVLVHSHKEGWSSTLQLNDPSDESRFRRFLSGARTIPRSTIVFLVRPDGIESYRRAERLVEATSLRHGKLALPGPGAIDFSLL